MNLIKIGEIDNRKGYSIDNCDYWTGGQICEFFYLENLYLVRISSPDYRGTNYITSHFEVIDTFPKEMETNRENWNKQFE